MKATNILVFFKTDQEPQEWRMKSYVFNGTIFQTIFLLPSEIWEMTNWCDPGLRRMKMSIKESKQSLSNWLVMVKITSIPYRSVCFPQMFPIWTSLAGYLVVLQQSMLGRSCNSSINHLTETFFRSRQLVQAVCPISTPSGVAIAHLIRTYLYL